MKNLFKLLLIIIIISGQWIIAQDTGYKITIRWTDHIDGDFSFADNWSYPEGIYPNQFGQVSCDGLCPPETDEMKDENGKIKEEQLTAFYQLVDTTHQYHSIRSEAHTYEWAGTDFMQVKRINQDSVIGQTSNNVATHSSLYMVITQNQVEPTIVLTSITPNGSSTFNCTDGSLTINRSLWEQGIMQAAFYFIFDEVMSDGQPMWWKGLIYAKIADE